MKRLLVDTGPIVALIDRSEAHHEWVKGILEKIPPPLFTCETVIAEAVYLLRSVGLDGTAPLDLLARGVLRIAFELERELGAVRQLIAKYAPRMDLADACLVRMTEIERDSRVLTLDGDFRSYRRFGRNVIPAILPGPTSRAR